MRNMAHSICLITFYQITMRKISIFFVSDYLNEENFINFVVVAIVLVIVLGHPFNKRAVF